VLSGHEQKVWADIERLYGVEADEPAQAHRLLPRRQTGHSRGLDEIAIGGVCIAIMLVFVGAPVAGLGIGGATAFGWLLRRFWPQSNGGDTASASPVNEEVHPYVGRRTRHRRSLDLDFRGIASTWSNCAAPLSAAIEPERWSGPREGEQRRESPPQNQSAD
jgi:hypothetical protein